MANSLTRRERGVVLDRGYVLIRFWPWGRKNRPHIEHFGPSTDANIKVANFKMREYRNLVSLGKFDIEPAATPILFKDAGQRVIKEHKASMRGVLESSLAYFDKYYLHDITPALIQAWREERAKSVKFTTINREQAVLAVVFEKIREWNATNGILGAKNKLPKDNPCQFITKPTERHEKRERVLSPEEWERLTPNLMAPVFKKNSTEPMLEAGWLLDHCKMGLYSSLSLKDVSSLSGKVIAGEVMGGIRSKTGIHFKLPLTESLRAIALRIAARPFVNAGVVQKYFREACNASGIRDCTFRDLRRTGLSWMDKLGVSRTTVRDRAAHGDGKTTELYLGSDTGEQLEGIKKLEEKFK